MADDDLERHWRIRMRRAFEIPGLIRDETAVKVIAWRAAHDAGFADSMPEIERLVEELPKLGAAGELDALFFEDRPWEDEGTEAPQTRVAAQVAGVRSDDKVLKKIFARMKAHVDEYPYGDAAAGYFNL